MSRDEHPSAHVGPEHEAVRSLDLPPTLIGARSERRCRTMAYREADVTDLLLEAGDTVVRYHSCCEPTPAPPSVVTCARRTFEVALVALRPPVSERICVHVCHISGQVGFQVTALDRRSFGRLIAGDDGQRALAEIVTWSRAFSATFSLQPVRRGRANLALVIPFDPRALPQWAHLRPGRPRRSLARRLRGLGEWPPPFRLVRGRSYGGVMHSSPGCRHD